MDLKMAYLKSFLVVLLESERTVSFMLESIRKDIVTQFLANTRKVVFTIHIHHPSFFVKLQYII
ncbi:hypothetical protein KUTeg_014030 [Tegillarca granosa]|uniref:Uncharacterized protein n=1 Tax=Tegillarca granosa TaxID=220873 RepID=A0ABQ9EVD9_TEGGR|nr:hypothetical protein KUTeg_014030 [Tegillarca granosa]